MNEDKENEVNNVESEVNQATNTAPANDKKGFSIAALVLGIIALVLCCIWYVSIPCGIIALILGIIGLKSSKRGFSIAGIITGIIGTLALIIILILSFGIYIFNNATDGVIDSSTYDDYSSYYRYD